MATYRKRDGSDTWHWCRNCSNDPKSGYKEQSTKPSSGELCNQCQSKDESNNCSK